MNALITFCLRRRVVVAVLLLMFLGGGAIAFRALNIEAYPDPVPPLIDIVTQSGGQSAEEIERYITIPLEVQLAGIPNVTAVRTISLFGLSDVKVQFTYADSYEQAKQRVLNRLSQLAPLPNGAQPGISPESPIGEIYRYRVVGPPGYSVMDLKTIQDWILQRRFKSVPGVIDVTGWGGKTKQYEVAVDLHELAHYGLTIPQVLQALNNADINVGGQTLNLGAQSAVVRGVGLIHSMDDIRDTMIATNNGVPVFVRDVATVEVGHVPRLGIAGQDGDDDIVQGIVLMRRGEQSLPTIHRVEAEVARINSDGILPPGVSIKPIYDRSELIAVTTHTVVENLALGIVLIFLVQWIFLGNLRSAIVVSATIPFGLFFAVAIMLIRGESANLLSVGAIDFGLIVEATVIMVENVFRHLAERDGARDADRKLVVIGGAAREVNRAIFFSAAIIIASFVPLFTLTGVEGHIFGPMARTYAYAIIGGLIATFTVSPALCALLLPTQVQEVETVVVHWMRRVYAPLFDFAMRNRILAFGGTALLAMAALLALRTLGLEFLPKLEEGNLWIRATMPSAVSLEGSNSYVNRMRTLIKRYPEVRTVVSQHGRPDDGTDTTGFFNAEFFVPLKPDSSWPRGIDKAELVKDMNAALEAKFPGVDFNFSQYIEDNVEEAASGVKGENSIKLFGNDLNTLQATAEKIEAVMQTVRGITDLSIFTEVGQPTVKIDVDRKRAARYGLAPGDVNAVVQAAIGGQAAGNLYERGSDRNFPIVVRLAQRYRGDLDAIRRIPVGAPNPNGNGVIQVPLGDLATVQLVSGASFIYREGQERYIPIKFSVRGRDLGGAVHEAQEKLAKQVKLPAGYRMEWAGELGALNDAMARLRIVVPLSLGLIGLLLYFHFGSMRDTLMAASMMPMALIGGIFALFVTGTPFSVSAAIGFIGLFGVSVMGGIIVLSHYNRLIDAGVARVHAIREACQTQLRPVMMTCNAACVGLLPAALSTGIGSQVQKPLAIVVVGGILLAPPLILGLLPLLIEQFSRRGEDSSAAPAESEGAAS